MVTSGPAVGETIGKFRVENVLGRGGMGVVLEATNTQLDQRVALKFLTSGLGDPSVVERFTREARAAVKLRSEHVARVFDVGHDGARGPYIVMELLDGSTLASVVRESGKIPVHRAAEYVIHACEGLAEAHARGIVHQDVKPGNLFLTVGNDGRSSVKLLDFGISKMMLTGSLDRATTTTGGGGASHGSPCYLAPEQLRDANSVDHRADIWAVGCVLFELVTGERAFRASQFMELVAKILEQPRSAIPDGVELPQGILDIIDRCLQKDPKKRYSSTGELALALLPYARRRAHAVTARAVERVREGGIDPQLKMPSSMPPAPSEPAFALVSSQTLRTSLPSIPDTSIPPATPPQKKGRTGLWIGLGAIAALLIGFGVVALRPGAPKAVGRASEADTAPAIAAATAPATSATTPVAPTDAPEPSDPAAAAATNDSNDSKVAASKAAPRRPAAVPVVARDAAAPAPARRSDSEIRFDR